VRTMAADGIVLRCRKIIAATGILAYVITVVNLLWSTLIVLWCVLPRKRYAHLSKKFVKWFLVLFVWAYERKTGYRTVMTGDRIPDRESALLIINHPGQDWAPLYSLALRSGMLGYVLPVVKSSLMMIPGFGWAMYLAGSIFLSRKFKRDKIYLQNMMQTLKEDDVPYHIWLFAEGHRFTEKGHREGVAFAKSRGMKPYKHLLVPRTKGFVQLKRGLGKHCDYIYDVTVAYSGMKPTVADLMLPDEHSHARGPHIHVRRIQTTSLPSDDDDAALDAWLKKLYREKDRLLDHFHNHGRFPGDQDGTKDKQGNTPKQRQLRPLRMGDCLPAMAVWGAIGAAWVSLGARLSGFV